ncbi:MAG TPA: serine/threonine-protein kinase, partial [Ktedonobacteraceae bacterium]|nr:serine/threonine-protein kinase [Ktedonobacteraceae bacterium]
MAADVVFCEHCGAANSLHARSCVFCGQAVNGPDDTHVGTGGAGHIKSGEMLKQRYRILARIGQGGFGAVYKAEDSALGQRLVAVKEMSPRNLSEEEREEAVASFKREALILAGLRHEHLPRIYEQFSENDHWYLVMDYIEGETLEERFAKSRNGSLPLVMVWQLAEQLCDILEYLHTRQPPIVFRDLKPSNIIIESSGNLFLIDFGIARHFKPGQAKDTIAFGSPGYAAPEQYGKAQTSSRADIYSLGAILHQMISGDDPSLAPFRFAPLVGYDPALQILILQMLEMDERRRPPTIARVHARLRQIRGGASWSGQAHQPLNQPLPTFLPPLPGSSHPSFSTLSPLPLPPNPPISALPPLPAPPNQIAPTLPPMARLTGAYHVPPASRPGQQMLMYSQPVPHHTPTSKSPL